MKGTHELYAYPHLTTTGTQTSKPVGTLKGGDAGRIVGARSIFATPSYTLIGRPVGSNGFSLAGTATRLSRQTLKFWD